MFVTGTTNLHVTKFC